MSHALASSSEHDTKALLRLAGILEASPAVSYALEPAGRCATFRSANAARHFGWSARPDLDLDQEHQDCWLRAVHASDVQPIEAQLQAWLTAGAEGVLRRSYRIRHGAGHELWIEDHLRAVRDEAGRVVELIGVMRDVTAWNGSDRQFDVLVRNVPGMIFQLLVWPDGSSCYPYASIGIRNIFGLEPEDVRETNAAVFERIHQDDVAKVEALIRDAAISLDSVQSHYRVLHPERGLIWVRGHSTPERLADGCVVFNGYIQETTAEEASKAALQRSRDELQGFFDVALDLLCIASLDGRFVRVNQAWSSTLGYDAAVLEGARFLDYVHPDDLDATLTEMASLSAGHQTLGFTNRYRGADGSYRIIEWRSQLHGKLIYAAARDVTTREQALRELQDSRNKLNSLYELAPIGIALNRLADGVFVQANPELLRLTGYTADDLGAHNFHDLVPLAGEDGAEPVGKQELFASGRYGPVERRLRKKDGSELHVLAQGVILRDRTGSPHVWSIIEDISARKRVEAELEANRERVQDFAESSADWFWEADGDLRLTWFSSGFAQLGALVLGSPLGRRLHELDPTTAPLLDTALQLRRPIDEVEAQIATVDGIRWCLLNGLPTFKDGVFSGYRGTGRDITERKETQLALAASRQKLRSLYKLAPVGIALNRFADGRFLEGNSELARLTGYSLEQLRHLTWRALTAEECREAEPAEWRDLGEHGRYGPCERTFVHADGHQVPVLLNGVLIEAPDGERQIWSIIQDVTEQRRNAQRLKALAEHDVLTGLVNRQVLTERVRAVCDHAPQARSAAVVLLDLDHFKEINDTLGHDAGDELLKEIAQRLLGALGADDVVARLGGDEFGLLLRPAPGTRLSHGTAEAKVRAVLDAVHEPLTLGKRTVQPQASLGVAMLPDDGSHPSELYKHADIALYRSKALGRDTFTFFDPSMRDDVERRSTIADALRATLATDGLSIALQPQQHLPDGRHAGFEALVRWQHEGRVMPPGAFVPIAEETGLILPMGRAVMHTALATLRRLLDRGLEPGWFAVNVAAAQLKDPNFVAELSQLIALHRLQPRQVELEITEGVLLDRGGERVAETLEAAHRLGVSIALDDFGTGYASLRHLNRFPVDRLKIDQSFVRDIGSDPQDAAITRAVINLAHSLSMDVVAEGVEREDQLAFLRMHGCDYAQGYLLGRPLDPTEVETYLRRQTHDLQTVPPPFVPAI
ncbi:MAG: EAL domain-containing protein [Geminicoccaceae bacterium]|nr:MAG: EAL domain-containing protein [Geminicoccaceae bacterium]